VDRRRAVTLVVNPPAGMSLEESIDILKQTVEPQILAMLPEDVARSVITAARTT
jgi:hypothetical protein